MSITIAICTWNRAQMLSSCLASLADLHGVENTVDVVVVDNNSTDETQAVLAAHRRRLPMTIVDEPRQGLSHARNAALGRATGDFVLWIDDDVRVDRGWLRAYAWTLAERPDAAFLGGPVRPDFEGSPPHWLVDALPRIAYAYALIDLGPQPFEFAAAPALATTGPAQRRAGAPAGPDIPFGANFGVSRRWLERHRFSTRLGRVGAGGILGEESDLLRRVLADGGRGYWVPGAGVTHRIPRERQTTSYLAAYFAMSGATQALRNSARAHDARLLGRSRRDVRAYLSASIRYFIRRASGDPRWVESLVQRSLARGRLRRRS
ncbi:MAG: glycosyltransferase [Burkholderiaceae bacterium]|nr:glycosyltransferase [Burkholderiaceae bacterium]